MAHTVHIRKLRNNTGLTFALEARALSRLLERSGFSVKPLPLKQCGFTLTHSNVSAITLFILQHDKVLEGWQVQ